MGFRTLCGLLLAVVVAVALVLVGRILLAADPHATQTPLIPAQAQPRDPTPQRAPITKLTPASRASVAVTFSGFPAAITQDPARRYAFAKDCAKFRHFDTFYREKATDPNWPLNSPENLAAADIELRTTLIETSRFLDRHRQSCESWLDTTSQDLENAQIYEAALQAALRGDQNAAACFVMAAWQKPTKQSPYYAGLVNTYTTYAPQFIQNGLRTGSWPIVLAAYQAAQEEQGLQARLGISQQDAYLLARLAQQGAPDALDESQHGYRAANAAINLTAADLVSLDKRASDLFANQFERQKVSAQSVTDMCVN